MPHEIVYEHIGPKRGFKTLRLVWEPVSHHVSLYFRTSREAANGVVRPVAEMVEYFDRRALAGPPWNSDIARAARERLAKLAGDGAPADPRDDREQPRPTEAALRRTG